MPCCGQRRARIVTDEAAASPPRGRNPPRSRVALYEYTGATAMTVTATFSGATYRFAAPGARVQVDMRDVSAITRLPNLRRVE